MNGTANLKWAEALIDELVRAGVRWFIVVPGSRSTPLVLAAAAHPQAQTVVLLDERSAAFFALGIGKAMGVPAAVITTSGTAVANLFPAVVEAAQSESPLLLLTADRPSHLLGGDANQAIDQRGVYGTYPKLSLSLGAVSSDPDALSFVRQLGARAASSALAQPQGPVHINVPFRKPLEPSTDYDSTTSGRPVGGREDGGPFTRVWSGPVAATTQAVEAIHQALSLSKHPLIVAGPTAGSSTGGRAARLLAAEWAVPLIADPLSGARFEHDTSEPLVVDYADLLLGDPAVTDELLPDAVIRFGRSPTSQRVVDLCARVSEAGGPVIVVDVGGRWKDHRASVTHMVQGDPQLSVAALLESLPTLPALAAGWTERWSLADDAAGAALGLVWDGEPFEGAIARSAARAIPADGVFFVSSSMPIRDVDTFVPSDDFWGRALGNRGASGIDGITSTALGAALASGQPLLCLVGDVAFLHDIGGLLATRSVESPVVFVVVNNDGGAIFHMLPIRDHDPAFTEFFATPHGRDFRHAAAMYDVPYAVVAPRDVESMARKALVAGGVHILEVASNRVRTRELRMTAAARVHDAARAALASTPSLTR